MMEPSYAVIGESAGWPTLYHMNQSSANAEKLRKRREETLGRPCFVVLMSAWHKDPLAALRKAETARFAEKTPQSPDR